VVPSYVIPTGAEPLDFARVTGKLPSDPKFQQERMAFLDQLGALLAAADCDG
jgi:hypothetical protein